MVEETFEPGMTVGLVARRHGVAPNQLFTWRRLVAQGGLTAAGSGEEVVPASDYGRCRTKFVSFIGYWARNPGSRNSQGGARTRHGLKKQLRLPPSPPKGGPMKTVAEAIGVSRSNLAERRQERPQKRKAVIGELPTYGYRRVHAILKRQALAAGLKPPNHKRIYRAMKVHGLLLNRS